MECGIFLLLLTHLLLVRAADDAVDSTQVKAGNVSTVNECYWSGEGPICDGKCRAGETVVSESKKNDGNGCIIGKKMYCCKGGAVLSSNNGTEPVALHHVKRQHVIEVTNSSSTQGQLLLGDTKDDCYWVGKSPNCKGSCLEGDYMVNTSRTANGSTCIVGKKKYCCKGSGTNNTLNDVHTHSGSSSSSTTEAAPVKQMTNDNSSSCYWVGKAPICLGSCRFGDYVADKSPTGDGGGKCESGQKKFCCARQQSTAPVSTEEPPPPLKTTTSIRQMDNVNNSISNWTSARPFQTRRRPTPRGLPINSTVTNRVKIVKIKRKLVMSTPTVANVSTSISMTSETWSTLAMAQSLLTLPSTTESTVTTTATSPSTSTESTTPTTITASTTASTTTTTATPTATPTTESTTTASTTASTPTTTESTSTTTAKTLLTTTASTTPTTAATTTPSTTTASATTTTESTTTATAATTPSTTVPPTITTTATTTTPSTTIASTTESTTPTIAATTTSSTTTALATTESTTTPSTTATTTTTIATPTTTTSSTTTTTESTTIETGTTSSTPIRHPIHHRIRHPTTLAARWTSTATESTSLATGPSTPATTSIKPTSARAPKKFEPFFNLPDVLPVPLIFRIQKSADTDITSLAANIATTSIIQSSTTSTTPTTLE